MINLFQLSTYTFINRLNIITYNKFLNFVVELSHVIDIDE